MRIAVLGGSFNPVHNGHLALADAVRCILGYDLVLFVPANTSPHKIAAADDSASVEHRLEMISLALEGSAGFALETCEIDRGGVSYTIDTLLFLAQKYESCLEGKLGLIVGADIVTGFSRWKDPDGIARISDIILASRPPDGPGAPAGEVFDWPHRTLSNPELAISSSGIRTSILNGSSWRYLVPEGVYRYIENNRLYERRTD